MKAVYVIGFCNHHMGYWRYCNCFHRISNTAMSGKPEFLMPSAFTPNKDGLNDCFGINNWEAIEQLNFTIYNRWGQPIFHSEKPGECWDGKFKGSLQPAGAYSYTVDLKNGNKTCRVR